jgi:hypothetical protein
VRSDAIHHMIPGNPTGRTAGLRCPVAAVTGGFSVLYVPSLLVFLLGMVVRGLSAQAPRSFDTSAWLRQSIEVSTANARGSCVVLPYRERFVEPPSVTSCDVLRYVTLDTAARMAWAYALYRHTSIYPIPAPPDTMVELELVLFSAALTNADRVSAIAHVRRDHGAIRDISAAVSSHDVGVLLQVEFCLNGTGGCWQELLVRRDGRWEAVDDIHALLVAELRRRGALRGARLATPRVDVRTLRGTGSLYDPRDSSCCPSRRIAFRLELTDRGIRLAELRVVPPNVQRDLNDEDVIAEDRGTMAKVARRAP